MKRTKERDRESEKIPQPDKAEVICPLIFKLNNLAVNYDLTWQSETKLTVQDDDEFTTHEVTGVWKSNPVQRGHTDAFQAELKRMREESEISWDESAYYFTHEEGVEARKVYEEMVLSGKLKAHITSWGPNPKKADDKARFHKFTGVTFQELEEKYPELYKRQTTARVIEPEEKEVKEAVAVEDTAVEEVKEEVKEPSQLELKEIQEEERVAAATKVADVMEDIEDELDDTDDHHTLILTVDPDELTERIDASHESIRWKSDDGVEMQAWLHILPEVGTEMWLSEGKWEINGQKYEVRVER